MLSSSSWCRSYIVSTHYEVAHFPLCIHNPAGKGSVNKNKDSPAKASSGGSVISYRQHYGMVCFRKPFSVTVHNRTYHPLPNEYRLKSCRSLPASPVATRHQPAEVPVKCELVVAICRHICDRLSVFSHSGSLNPCSSRFSQRRKLRSRPRRNGQPAHWPERFRRHRAVALNTAEVAVEFIAVGAFLWESPADTAFGRRSAPPMPPAGVEAQDAIVVVARQADISAVRGMVDGDLSASLQAAFLMHVPGGISYTPGMHKKGLPMLQLKKIRKEYKTGDLVQTALNDVSLNLRDSEFVAILGPSGSARPTAEHHRRPGSVRQR